MSWRTASCLVCLLLAVARIALASYDGNVAKRVDLHYEHKELYYIKNSPMKILVHYDESINRLNEAEANIIKCSLMPALVHWVSDVIKVHSTHSKFLLERQCLNNFNYLINGKTYCKNGCAAETKCGPVTIPENHLHGCDSCTSGDKCITRSTDEKYTLKGDYVLYVSSTSDLLCQNYHLSASHCQQEKDFDRPIAGYLNFCPGTLFSDPSVFQPLLTAAMHELLHMLAFSSELLPYFRDNYGAPRTARDSFGLPVVEGFQYEIDNTLIRVKKPKWTTVKDVFHTVTLVTTPNVQRETRQHFRCDDMEGAEVENQGAKMRRTLHWEKRLFGNDLMTADYSPSSVISRITLAYLEDTGWYNMNYSYAGELVWGRHKGCHFVNDSCGGWIQHSRAKQEDPSPFCDEDDYMSGKFSCTNDHRSIARCNMRNFTYLPKEYQYFSSGDYIYPGGSLPRADYCPFYQEVIESSQVLYCGNTYAPKGIRYLVGMESYGSTSACFKHGKKWAQKVQRKKKDEMIETQRGWGAGCYKYKCTAHSIVISVANSEYECTKAGEMIEVYSPFAGMVHEGSLICPEYKKLCYAYGCDNMCSRHGSCVNNVCHCDPGYYGKDCRYSYQMKTMMCSDVTCRNGGTCVDKDICGFTCQCPPQYSGDYCEQYKCPVDYCSGHGRCVNNFFTVTCRCDEGYTGSHCNIKQDYCSVHGNPCENGGTCVSSNTNTFYCKCPSHYTGIFCEELSDHCYNQPCKNGATCINVHNDFYCHCPENFVGKRCAKYKPNKKFQPYSSRRCHCLNGGVCTETDDGFNCTCIQGYTGIYCEHQIDPCSSSPCPNGTRCTSSGDNNYTCECSGKNCTSQLTKDLCSPIPCLNGGTCLANTENDFTCKCVASFYGKRCENSSCTPNPCKHGGECSTEEDGKYKCQCHPMYSGEDCQTHLTPQSMPCPSQSCQNGGVCSLTLPQHCICPPQFEGPLCQQQKDPCHNNDCENDTTCVPVGYDDYLCDCTEPSCNITVATIHCQNDGRAVDISDGSQICLCAVGYSGPLCQYTNHTNPCVPDPCRHGSCSAKDDTYSCQCSEGFTGDHCDQPDYCELGYCLNGASCVHKNDSVECICADKFHGRFCSIPTRHELV